MTQRRALAAYAGGQRINFRIGGHTCSRWLTPQIAHADQVISGCREGEHPSHLEDSAVPNLP